MPFRFCDLAFDPLVVSVRGGKQTIFERWSFVRMAAWAACFLALSFFGGAVVDGTAAAAAAAAARRPRGATQAEGQAG